MNRVAKEKETVISVIKPQHYYLTNCMDPLFYDLIYMLYMHMIIWVVLYLLQFS